MGMTDKQFNGHLRFVLESIKEAMAETDKEKHDEKLKKLYDILQKTLED